MPDSVPVDCTLQINRLTINPNNKPLFLKQTLIRLHYNLWTINTGFLAQNSLIHEATETLCTINSVSDGNSKREYITLKRNNMRNLEYLFGSF